MASLELEAVEQNTIRQYLLGQVPREDAVRLEERLLSESDFFEELVMAEDELIDQYLGGGLSEADRPGFETHFLSAPERQQKVRFASNLKRYIGTAATTRSQAHVVARDSAPFSTDAPKSRLKKRPFLSFLPFNNPLVSYSLAATVLLVALGASWVAIRNWRNQTPHEPGNVLAVVLAPGLTREGGEIKKVQIHTDFDTLRLHLELPANEYESFRAAILTEERAEVWIREGLRPTQKANSIDFDVPSHVLKLGDYHVKVSGRLPNGRYEDLSSYRLRLIP